MRVKAFEMVLVVGWAVALASCSAGQATEPPRTLKIGVAQLALESALVANRDKIARFIGEAKDRGCRVVVFPETSLFWLPNTTKAEIDAAVENLRQVVASCDLYALIGGLYQRDGKE